MALSPLRKLVTAIVFELQGEEAANNAVNALRNRLEQVSAAATGITERLAGLGASHTALTEQQLTTMSQLSEADKARAHEKDMLMTRIGARQQELAERAAERELNSYARDEAQERRQQERRAAMQARDEQRAATEAARKREREQRDATAAAERAARMQERADRASEAQARREARDAERTATAQARIADREARTLSRAQAQQEAQAARAAARQAASDERGVRAQLRLMDRYSTAQGRLDRQVMRDKERAAQNEARLIAAREREQRALERRDETEARRAAAEQRRILNEEDRAERRSAQEAARMRAEANADNRRFDADGRRRMREAQAARRQADAAARRAEAEAAASLRAHEAEKRRVLNETRAQQRAAERETARLAREEAAAVRSAEAEKRQAMRETAAVQAHAHASSRESLHSIMHFGTALGLLYTGHQLIHMADEWSFVTATIKNSTNGVQEYGAALSGLMSISQRAGVGIEAPLRLYNQLAANRSETHLGQNDILDITDTVTRGIALNHGTNAQNLRAMRQFDEMLSQGRLSRQHMNSLRVDNPYLANIMAQAAGGQRHLDDDIHSRRADLNYIIELVRKMRVIVDHDFGHVQTTFGMAAARIRNAFMQLMGEFIIDNRTLSTGLDVVTGAVERLIHGVEAAAHAVGGFDQAAKLAGIAFAAIIGPSVISGVIALGTALLPLVLPWAAMAAGIAGVLLLLDDLSGWVNGKDSMLGMLFGDFDQYKEQLIAIKDAFLDAFGLTDAMKNVHSVRDALHAVLGMITGLSEDPATHWTIVSQLHDALDIIEQILKDVGVVTGAVGKAYHFTTDWMDNIPKAGGWLHDHVFSHEGMGNVLSKLGSLGATPLYPDAPDAPTARSPMLMRHVYDGLGQFVAPSVGQGNTNSTYNIQGDSASTRNNYLSTLTPVVKGGDTHIDASVTVHARTGASPREIADTVSNRQASVLRNGTNQTQRKAPVSFPVAEAGAVSQ